MANHLLEQLFGLFLVALVGIGMSCNENATQGGNPNLSLKLSEVGVTEAWIHFESLTASYGGEVVIKRDGVVVLTLSRTTLDTVWRDGSLNPRRTYAYRAYKAIDSSLVDASNILSLTTMDTTNHDFTWQIDTLGDGNNSVLKDVAIVNDTCIFAVGEIHLRDSSGAWDPTLYNVARWNGARWAFSVGAPVALSAVYAFSETDVWAGSSAPAHFDGSGWREYNVTGLFDGEVSKIWGTSSNNVYMVGTNGAIMHFDGTSWARMNSGTNVDLFDVWGTPNGTSVWACGYFHSQRGTYLLSTLNTSLDWTVVYDGSASESIIRADSLSGAYSSLFVPITSRLIVVSDAGLYQTTFETRGEATRYSFTPSFFPGFPNRIRGNGVNDLTIVGYYTMIAHFNGVTWRYFDEYIDANEHLYSVDQRGALTVAVGEIYDPIDRKCLVFRGSR